ncbi:hypothetical protein [Laspinema olomoucense]|uniref:hypothetical protein n=1 Tax=Laspinema olomoucense TaxID=3231600 RepID=UPI0021BB0D1B|nr:hypothetical protein [Laspinema sp. D3d]MCT7971186.1 hypothetical protein [Laspinema sp. D3d]
MQTRESAKSENGACPEPDNGHSTITKPSNRLFVEAFDSNTCFQLLLHLLPTPTQVSGDRFKLINAQGFGEKGIVGPVGPKGRSVKRGFGCGFLSLGFIDRQARPQPNSPTQTPPLPTNNQQPHRSHLIPLAPTFPTHPYYLNNIFSNNTNDIIMGNNNELLNNAE